MKAQYSKYFYHCLLHLVTHSRSTYSIDCVNTSKKIYEAMPTSGIANVNHDKWVEYTESMHDVRRIGSYLSSRPSDVKVTGGARDVIARCDELYVIYRDKAAKSYRDYMWYRTCDEIINSDRTLKASFIHGHAKWTNTGLVGKEPPSWTVTGRRWQTVNEFGKLNLQCYLAALMQSRGASWCGCQFHLTGDDVKNREETFDRAVDVVDAPEGPVRALVHMGNTVGGYPILGMLDCRIDKNGDVIGWPEMFPFKARAIMFKGKSNG